MAEYNKTELIRKCVQDVKKRAVEDRKRRESPAKTFANVKSKITQNKQAQVKAKKVEKQVERIKVSMSDLLSRRIGQHGQELELGIDELEKFYKGEHWSSKFGGQSPERES